MKIGIIVDGDAEFASLPNVLDRIETENEILRRILKAPVHPLGAPGKIVRSVMPQVRLLVRSRGAGTVLLLLDRENSASCCGATASLLSAALAARCKSEGMNVVIEVVLKNRAYENWLVADVGALRKSPGRFRISQAFVRKVQPNKADLCDATALIKGAVVGASYDKVGDSVRVMSGADPIEIAAHSRSFRRFLRVVGARQYLKQSRIP